MRENLNAGEPVGSDDQGGRVRVRGRGHRSRGRGRDTPNVEANDPLDLATIINQAATALIPTLVAQVTAAIRGENVNQNVDDDAQVHENETVNRASSVTEELVRGRVLNKPIGSKRRSAGESSGVVKGKGFEPKRHKKGKASAVVEPVKKVYKGPHPLCILCNFHHSAHVQCGACHLCSQMGHFARSCPTRKRPGVPLNVVPVNARNPQGNRGVCFECGSPDHYRDTCPLWVGQRVQVAVHPNQLQITSPNHNRGQRGQQQQQPVGELCNQYSRGPQRA